MKNDKTKLLVYAGLFTALTTIATYFFKIETLIGYVNLGDGVIFAAAYALGPIAALVGGVGSALADLFAGYVIYIPATFVIKTFMGFFTAKMMKLNKDFMIFKNLLIFLFAEIVMVGGYFIFESIIYGMEGALGSVIPNICQGIVGIGIGMFACLALKKTGLASSNDKH